MDWDEPTKKPKPISIGEDLRTLSVADLEARVAALEVELVRLRAEIAAKRAQQSAAASFFKS